MLDQPSIDYTIPLDSREGLVAPDDLEETLNAAQNSLLPPDRAFLNRLVATVTKHELLTALFLGGSHAAGTADEHSDLDLYLLTTDSGFEDFRAGRKRFMGQFGDLLFLEEHEDFGFLMLLYMYADGVHGEIALAPTRDLTSLHSGPYETLVDKSGLLAGRTFPPRRLDEVQRRALTRSILVWFWYDRRLLDAALARGRLWTAHYYLERCRRACANLVRLRSCPEAWPGGYERLELDASAEALETLAPTVVPLEREPMLEAAHVITRTYEDLGRQVARMQGVDFPDHLANALMAHFAGK